MIFNNSRQVSKKFNGYLLWLDLEMTGLDPENDRILEIATIITDQDLQMIAKGPEVVIHQDEKLLEQMDDWNRKQHSRSGLWERVRTSSIGIQEAEQKTLSFVQKYIPLAKSIPLAGNSIWQDRRFLVKYMPTLEGYAHYRIVDVSSIKECIKRWYPKEDWYREKKNTHRALEDIEESIQELEFYRKKFFIKT